jgi:hypothetical protein
MKVKEFSGQLFRAEKSKGMNHTRANQHYNRNIPYHFFTTVKNEVESYRKFGTTYTKTWQTTEPLLLIDIMDFDTRKMLEKQINKQQLNVAFPIIDQTVYRVSEDDTVHTDSAILGAICSLRHNDGRPIDGYYMKRQDKPLPPSIIPFHSEIGLCQNAFRKLMLVTSEKLVRSNRAPNRSSKRKRPNNTIRLTRNNNNNIPKRPKTHYNKMSLLFNNL